MRPFVIEIRWIDYNPTLDDDIYLVTVKDQTGQETIAHWETTGDNVGASISKYMQR